MANQQKTKPAVQSVEVWVGVLNIVSGVVAYIVQDPYFVAMVGEWLPLIHFLSFGLMTARRLFKTDTKIKGVFKTPEPSNPTEILEKELKRPTGVDSPDMIDLDSF